MLIGLKFLHIFQCLRLLQALKHSLIFRVLILICLTCYYRFTYSLHSRKY